MTPYNSHGAGVLSALMLFVSIQISKIHAVEAHACHAGNVRHVIVYQAEGKYAGWPANEGGWSWGNEILVAFKIGAYLVKEKSHNIDLSKPRDILFARSVDGGLTWQHERHPTVCEPRRVPKDAYASRQAFDFSKNGFAMRIRNNIFWVSMDRGHTWHKPSVMIEGGAWNLQSRTCYQVLGSNSLLVFGSGERLDKPKGIKKRNRSIVLRTDDGGTSYKFMSLIGDDAMFVDVPGRAEAYSIMPSTVRTSDGALICGLREGIGGEKWVRIYESTNEGVGWHAIATIARAAHNPVALVELKDGRLAAIYGSRETNTRGMYAVLSSDRGKSWSSPIALREDAQTWDFGYPRAFLRPDNVIVIIYYYATKSNSKQHIAATLWTPPDIIEKGQ